MFSKVTRASRKSYRKNFENVCICYLDVISFWEKGFEIYTKETCALDPISSHSALLYPTKFEHYAF